ncbi:hypothetical protein [Colwellia psychrerythraea]|uniref:Uncharacterized protein n=1 Tax=Colwellia psychrerythraea TaxID=28229 RepID=A0A099KQF6_COLPS|nr:hypothetical protein [Colwellia psychrerythraea]KGJ91908.1 hypothetical protein GAB14E_3065 [Colwellia psychrerythraea]
MKIKIYSGVILLLLIISSYSLHARNWTSGYTITKVYDQRPYKAQLDIDISPKLHECTTLSFVIGEGGLTDDHLNRILSVSLVALTTGKQVGGLWADVADKCIATNIHISK